jgi:hypothetical protein
LRDRWLSDGVVGCRFGGAVATVSAHREGSARVVAMNSAKTVGLGVGTIVAGTLASCPIVQAAVLGMFGGLGILPFAQRYRPVLVLAIFGCAALAIYSVVRVRRSRRVYLS